MVSAYARRGLEEREMRADMAPPAPITPRTPPHFHGHRQRLRERFETAGADALADYEMLELLLFRAIPRRDVKPLAKALLARFENLAGVLGAEPARLCETPGVSRAVALELNLVQAAAQRITRDQVLNQPVFSNLASVVAHCRAAMAHEAREQFRVLFLDRKNRLIADEVMGRGTVDHAPVYVREVVARALALGSTAIILAHNHPSGDPTPSRADIDMTGAIIAAAKPMGVVVHDHLVVGRERVASFRDLGLLNA